MNSTQMKSKITKLAVTSLLIVTGSTFAQNKTPVIQTSSQKPDLSPEEVTEESSFGLGYENARSAIAEMRQSGLELDGIDIEAYLAGVKDGLEGKQPDAAKVNRIKQAYSMLGERLVTEQAAKARKNLAEARAFLEANKRKEGVITTASGLQYIVLKKGEGKVFEAPADPTKQANVRFMVHYKGMFTDGEVFEKTPNYDESEGRRPVPYNLSTVSGFREALMMMPVGSKWKIFLAPELGYGADGKPGRVPANSVLIFELELEDIKEIPMPAPIPENAGE